jgi:catechol 2,3-dioxygenase-like lactoylglutathione lyase family enzyme
VSVSIDHLGLAARDAESAARWLAEILGVGAPVADGPDQDMYTVALGGTSSLVFSTAPTVPTQHIAFGVDQVTFRAIVERLHQRRLSFGNDPEEPENGQTTDPLGALGRVYFTSPDGHFLEVTVSEHG